MSRLDPDSGVDYAEPDDAAGAPDQGLAPAGSLTSIQIRRRLPVQEKRTVAPPPPAPAPAARSGGGHWARGMLRPNQPAPPSMPPAAPPSGERRSPDGIPAPGPRAEAPARSPRPEGIASYWTRLRDGRRFPSVADLDRARVASDWPTSILIRCRSGSRVLEPERIFFGADSRAAAGKGGTKPLELSPMLLQWLLSIAGEAVRDGRPMEDTEAFPALTQSIRYRAVALPFSDDQRSVDHVLCYVSPVS